MSNGQLSLTDVSDGLGVNLFQSLFTWRPSENKTSSENFLTEAFVYCLRINQRFCQAWLSELIGTAVDVSDLTIVTRASHRDEDQAAVVYPDIDIQGRLTSGERFKLLVEVKWNAPYDPEQLRKYSRLLSGPKACLVFISPQARDCQRAAQDAVLLGSNFKSLRWDQVHRKLALFASDCRMTRELVEFMDFQGLGASSPISEQMLFHYLQSRDFLPRLLHYTRKLHNEYDWDFLPAFYHSRNCQEVRDVYGRIGISFRPRGWNGAISVGFLYSTFDHKVPFADGSNAGVDVVLRIECAPRAPHRAIAEAAVRHVADEARKAGGIIRIAGDPENGNAHTLLLAQRSLSDFLKFSTESEQLDQIYQQIRAWAESLFADGSLGEALAFLVEPEPKDHTPANTAE